MHTGSLSSDRLLESFDQDWFGIKAWYILAGSSSDNNEFCWTVNLSRNEIRERYVVTVSCRRFLPPVSCYNEITFETCFPPSLQKLEFKKQSRYQTLRISHFKFHHPAPDWPTCFFPNHHPIPQFQPIPRRKLSALSQKLQFKHKTEGKNMPCNRVLRGKAGCRDAGSLGGGLRMELGWFLASNCVSEIGARFSEPCWGGFWMFNVHGSLKCDEPYFFI